MLFRDVLTLVSETPENHGAFDDYIAKTRDVFCTVKSVGMNEAYQALSHGLHPIFVFVLSDFSDYNGEKICLYKERQYRIVRTYRNNQAIELTVEEGTVDGKGGSQR